MISRDDMLSELVRFFMDEFSEDADGVRDWIAQGDYDVDEFVAAVQALKAEID